ncbi:IS256 family transposase [Verrucosispora sp. NA02020]|uniref:IS256 family transposase n=1 Tax=Verrucosispora sp. NA02020 TaxID=2742132 RepID=UPI003D7319B1
MTDVVFTEADTGQVAKRGPARPVGDGVDDQLVAQVVEQARAAGLQLTGEGGLLQQLTKRVLEAALDGEITDHLGYDKGDPAGNNGQNSRNGVRGKTVLTEVGPVQIEVPRDRDGTFEPQIVRKRQRRLSGVEDMVISLSAKGLTTGEIQAHLSEVYGADVSRQTISTITDKVVDGMTEWQNRPLDPVYPVIFLDAVHVKIRDGKVANRPIYVALAVTVDGNRDILGIWAGDGGEGAKFWLSVLTELKNRGIADACMVVCDGLKGLPDAIGQTWPEAVVQTCVIHLLRASFRYAGRQHWDSIAKALKPVYTAATEAAARERFAEFTQAWGGKYPAIIRLWDQAWAEFVPFLAFDAEIRTVICSTNAIESVNARIRRAVRARGHFPNEGAALKCVYLAVMSLDPTGQGRRRWTMRWKPALNAFEMAFEGRLTASRK